MIYLWRDPTPHFREALYRRQWWKLALGLAAFISVPAYEFWQFRKPQPGMPPATHDTTYYIAMAGLGLAGVIIVLLLVASILSRSYSGRSSSDDASAS